MMSNNKTILGIGLAKDSSIETSQLPVLMVYATDDGDYLLLEQETLNLALIQIIKNLEREDNSVAFMAVKILPIAQRVRRV